MLTELLCRDFLKKVTAIAVSFGTILALFAFVPSTGACAEGMEIPANAQEE